MEGVVTENPHSIACANPTHTPDNPDTDPASQPATCKLTNRPARVLPLGSGHDDASVVVNVLNLHEVDQGVITVQATQVLIHPPN